MWVMDEGSRGQLRQDRGTISPLMVWAPPTPRYSASSLNAPPSLTDGILQE